MGSAQRAVSRGVRELIDRDSLRGSGGLGYLGVDLMRGSTHLAAGLLCGVMIGPSVPGVAAAALGALVPDWFQINIPGANNVARGISGHRGITHCVLATGLAWLVVLFVSREMSVYIAAGWLSHIALDVVAGGAPALWPIPKRITLANIKTGGNLDSIVGGALLALAGVIAVAKYL